MNSTLPPPDPAAHDRITAALADLRIWRRHVYRTAMMTEDSDRRSALQQQSRDLQYIARWLERILHPGASC